MLRQHAPPILAVLLLVVAGMPAHAQETQPPLVVFIEDRPMDTSSILDSGPDGITRLEEIFKSAGARTRWLSLAGPLPRETAVIVLVRPLRALPGDQLARLWVQMARGSNLLLAIDPGGLTSARPDGSPVANPDKANSGLSRLLERSFGIGLEDTFVVAPWFTHASITSQLTAYSFVLPEDFAQHPVLEPLAAYGLPVLVWGARTVTVDARGIGSTAMPLLYTTSGYGETDTKVFDQGPEPAPLEVNWGQDRVGRLLIGALGENTRLGAKVVVLGDSEVVQNDFGLAVNARTGTPLYWGNRLLTERLVAWLLDFPEEDWPDLPDGYTRVAVDGQMEDWPEGAIVIEDPLDAPLARYDIVRAHAFRDNSYLYLRVETAETPGDVTRLTVGIENTYDGATDVIVRFDAQQVLASGPAVDAAPVLDGALAVGAVIEARLPLRIAGEGGLISQVCLADRRTGPDSAPVDCTDQPPAVVPVVNNRALLDVWYPPVPLVTVYTTGADAVNLRALPGTEAQVLDVLVNGQVLAVTGRTEAGDWVRVENARHTGWLAQTVVRPNVAIETLPVAGP